MVATRGNTSGAVANLTSLAAVKSRPGFGLQSREYHYPSVAGAFTNETFPANPARVWAIIQNQGAGRVYYSFGANPDTTAGAESLYLDAGEILQIDQYLPWWGDVRFTALAASNITVVEVSLASQ